jgi:hypothetical protein
MRTLLFCKKRLESVLESRSVLRRESSGPIGARQLMTVPSQTHGTVTQSVFLQSLGIMKRVEILNEKANGAHRSLHTARAVCGGVCGAS